MVVRGNLSPDPSCRPDEDILPQNLTVIVGSGSDSEEEEEVSYEGYQVLPQEFVDLSNAEIEDNDSEEGSSDEGTNINISLSDIRETTSFDQSTKAEVTELWNESGSRLTDIVMDSTKEEQIKNAMAGFKLPSTAIPAWAAQIPEEEWKEQLKNRVALLNKITTF